MYRRICAGHYQFHDKYWSEVSNDAKDFISKVLVVNPNERLTADQALRHSWFTRHDRSTSMGTNLKDNLEQLKVFNLKRKLRAAVYTVIATNKFTSLGIHLNSMMMDRD
jgi:calcium/calmodulin-dependent protein kinase I